MLADFGFFPQGASETAGRVDAIYLFLVGVSLFFATAICLTILVFAIRFRRRPGVKARQIHGSTMLELTWIAIPLVIVMGTFAWGARIYYDIKTPPDDVMEIYVTGKQWMWKLQHPTGHREINALHVPTGRKVMITLTSEDVIHSFYVPAFRIKQDAVPGLYTRIWFTANRPGRYHLFCAEYCGTKHAEMIGEVVVMEPAQYEAWLEGRVAELPPAAAGKVLFESLRCNTCHMAGAGQRGAQLVGRFGGEAVLEGGRTVPFDEAYVRESILEPKKKIAKGFQPIMPTFKGQVTEGQILQLIAYIKSLADEKTESDK